MGRRCPRCTSADAVAHPVYRAIHALGVGGRPPARRGSANLKGVEQPGSGAFAHSRRGVKQGFPTEHTTLSTHPSGYGLTGHSIQRNFRPPRLRELPLFLCPCRHPSFCNRRQRHSHLKPSNASSFLQKCLLVAFHDLFCLFLNGCPQAIPLPGSFITDGLDRHSAHDLPLIPITVGQSRVGFACIIARFHLQSRQVR
jgi:hypothetical protein